jgi:hypothetical protein
MSGSDYNCATVLHGIFSIHADSIHADDDALRGQTNALVVTDRLLTRSRLERSRVAADAFACC